jgi:hypothetical protein
MKVAKITSAVFSTLAIGLFAFIVLLGGTVKGTITPLNGGIKCWAISQTDTFQTNIANGAFELSNLKPGTYRITIEAIPPFKNAVREGIDIRNGEVTDIGEIRLQQ